MSDEVQKFVESGEDRSKFGKTGGARLKKSRPAQAPPVDQGAPQAVKPKSQQ